MLRARLRTLHHARGSGLRLQHLTQMQKPFGHRHSMSLPRLFSQLQPSLVCGAQGPAFLAPYGHAMLDMLCVAQILFWKQALASEISDTAPRAAPLETPHLGPHPFQGASRPRIESVRYEG